MLSRTTCAPLLIALAVVVLPSSGFSFSKRAEATKITTPHTGDRITTGIDLEIRWEGNPSDRPVSLELRKGLSHNITTVHAISSETPNNGSYRWRSRDDRFLRASYGKELPDVPISGCDYVIALREAQTVIHSDYFTIVNLNDDGLNPNIPCPGNSGPPKNEGGSGSKSSPNLDTSPNNNGSVAPEGVTTGALAGAVGGAAGGLIFIFTAILFFGRRGNWFIREEYIQKLVEMRVFELQPIMAPVQPPPEQYIQSPFTYAELSGHHTHQLLDGTPKIK
ncbi:hypothetical protein PABG_07654 [Paracoccidioides brasiliensis Pb03]|nr:hypothetical protein PABG_07654 [Paracoccidioides brasiliensis Pb03]